MTRQEAIELLDFHSCAHTNIDNPKWEKGYLGMLRPFRGQLYEDNFLELMEILKVLSNDLRKNIIDKKIISNLWSICQLSRNWAIEEEGMLRRNNLLSDEQINKISTWTDCISSTIMFLLEDSDEETAFETFKLYLDSNSSLKKIQ